jgi:hypothetical protein
VIQWEGEAPEAEGEAPGTADRQRRMKSLTIDLPVRLYRRFKLAWKAVQPTTATERR